MTVLPSKNHWKTRSLSAVLPRFSVKIPLPFPRKCDYTKSNSHIISSWNQKINVFSVALVKESIFAEYMLLFAKRCVVLVLTVTQSARILSYKTILVVY
jgi:hypothetical protein